MNKHLWIIASFLVIVVAAFYVSSSTAGKKVPTIRVMILKTSGKVVLSGEKLSLKAKGFNQKIKGRSHTLKPVKGSRISISPDLVLNSPLEVKSENETVLVDGNPYRGKLVLHVKGGKLLVVNILDMEKYLAGIINHEISSKWPLESIKAQSIAARTYAMRKVQANTTKLYDIYSTTRDQVYGGSGLEDAPSRAAVNATKGIVITYKGSLIEAFYHSSCGGHTADAGEVWGKSVPYLKSITCKYCQDAPKYFWRVSIPTSELVRKLKKSGINIKKIRSIKVTKNTSSGRAREVVLDGGGQKTSMSGEDLRRRLGYARLFSAFFQVEIDGDDAIFRGRGAGHGIGMCQWGAKGLAMEGNSSDSILKFYYRGVELKKIY